MFHKVKEEGTDLFKSLMIYHNTPLSSTMQSPMQMLQNRTTDHSFQCLTGLGNSLDSVQINLCIHQDAMFQNSISKRWYPATITSLCDEPRSYKIATRDGVICRKMQVHLKSYKPQNKQCVAGHSIMKMCNIQTVNPVNKANTDDDLVQHKPKRDIMPPGKLRPIVKFHSILKNWYKRLFTSIGWSAGQSKSQTKSVSFVLKRW